MTLQSTIEAYGINESTTKLSTSAPASFHYVFPCWRLGKVKPSSAKATSFEKATLGFDPILNILKEILFKIFFKVETGFF